MSKCSKLTFQTNSVQYLQQKIKCNQLTKEMEQYIINNNSDLNAVHKLQTLCQQLNFQAIFVLVNDHKKSMFEYLNFMFKLLKLNF